MHFRMLIASLIMAMSSTAWAENWVEVYRDSANDPQGSTYLIDRDSMKIRKGIVFFMSKTQERQTRNFSMGQGVYDYQIGQYAVDCKHKTMTGLGNAFYLNGGRLVGDVPMDEDVVFTNGRVNKALFDKIEDPDSPWASKINHACTWLKKKGKH